MPAAKTKKVNKTSKVTKKTTKSRSTAKHAPVQLSWKRVAAIVLVPFLAVATLAIGMTVSYATTQQVVTYDALSDYIPDSTTGTYFEAQHISEFGSQVRLAGTERNNTTITVVMNSMACQSGSMTGSCTTTAGATFNHPVTLNVYRVGPDNAVGSRIASVTRNVTVPYRPSADGCGGVAYAWSNKETATCHTVKSFAVDFDVVPVEKADGDISAGTPIPMPDNVIVTVSFNTQHEGYAPMGAAGPYNYLGVGGASAPSVGEILPGGADAYVTYSPEGQYCFESGNGDGTLKLDPFSMCWGGNLLAFKVASSSTSTTTPPAVPSAPTLPKTADECKKDNWKTFTYKFKNQGDCVSYTENGKL